MGMLQPGGQADLALEPVGREAFGEVGAEHLDHHFPSQRSLVGHEHPAHASTAELPLDDVGGAERPLQPVLNIGAVHVLKVRGER